MARLNAGCENLDGRDVSLANGTMGREDGVRNLGKSAVSTGA